MLPLYAFGMVIATGMHRRYCWPCELDVQLLRPGLKQMTIYRTAEGIIPLPAQHEHHGAEAALRCNIGTQVRTLFLKIASSPNDSANPAKPALAKNCRRGTYTMVFEAHLTLKKPTYAHYDPTTAQPECLDEPHSILRSWGWRRT